jgi:hypothetical protein
MIVKRPPFVTVPLADGLRWRGGAGWRYEKKLDGVWTVRQFGQSFIVGETVPGGQFIAFDIPILDGQDIRREPLAARLGALDGFNLPRPACGQGGEFLEAVLARGGEGVVAKRLDDPYGALWWKCKRVETFDLVVVEKATDRRSIRLALPEGEPRGWCPCFAEYFNVRVGDVVEVAAYGLTARGMLREPRFVRTRPDKAALLAV